MAHGIVLGASKSLKDCIWYHTQKNHSDPFGYFYLLIEIHKTPISTQPVCSNCASIVHPLGKWLDQTLQSVVTKQHAYFKDSFSL